MRLPGSYRAALRIAHAAAFLLADHLPRTAVVRENLRLAFGRADPQLVRAIYRHFAEAFVDTLYFPRLYDPSRFAWHFRYEGPGWEHFTTERPKSAIIATGHFGNWELLGASTRDAGIRLSCVVRSSDAYLFSRRLNEFRRCYGQEIIQKSEAALGTIRAVRRGRTVAFLMDQSAGTDGVEATFFGRPAWTHTAPVVLARRLSVPLYACYSTRLGPGIRYRCHFEHVPLSDDAAEVVRRLNAIFERFVCDRPEQWWWFHRRFKPPHYDLVGRGYSAAGIPIPQ